MATLAAAPLVTPRAGIDRDADDSLVASVRVGDDHAFEQLYLRYQRRIGAYVYGMVHDHGRAEDITQEVFMSALRRMRATDGRIAFKPWIYEIAKNACIDAFRRSRRAEEISYDADEGGERLHLVSNGPTPDAAVDTRMSLDHLRGAFGGLSEAHHQILVMRELEGLSYREIGDRLGMSRPSVESTLFRARRRLSEEYEELVSGDRCQRVQAIIAGATDGQVGTRDERKMVRHVSYCQPCRRAALVAGFDPDALVPKRTVREKLAALLPLPAFLKRRIAGSGDDRDHASTWMAAAHYVEPASGGWMKLAATASALVLAGMGAHTVRSQGDDTPASGATPAAAAAHSHGAAGQGATTTIGANQAPPTHGSTAGNGSSHASGTASQTTSGAQNSGGAAQGAAGASQTPAAGASNGASGSSGARPTAPITDATHSATGAAGQGSAPQIPNVQLPTAQLPKVPGAPPVVKNAVNRVNGVAGAATGAVNSTVGKATGAVNNAVGQTTGAANKAVGGVTGAVGGTVGGATKAAGDTVGGTTKAAGDTVGGTTKAAGDTVAGVTGSTGNVLGGG